MEKHNNKMFPIIKSEKNQELPANTNFADLTACLLLLPEYLY